MYSFVPNYQKLKRFVRPWNRLLLVSDGPQQIDDESHKIVSSKAKELGTEISIDELLWFVLYLRTSGEIGSQQFKALDHLGITQKQLALELSGIKQLDQVFLNPDVAAIRIEVEMAPVRNEKGIQESKRYKLALDSPGLILHILEVLEKHRKDLSSMQSDALWDKSKNGSESNFWYQTKVIQMGFLFDFLCKEITNSKKVVKERIYRFIAEMLKISGGPNLESEAIKKALFRLRK